MKKFIVLFLCLALLSCDSSISNLSTVSISNVTEIESGGSTTLSSPVEYTLFTAVPRSTSSTSSGSFNFRGVDSRSAASMVGILEEASENALCSLVTIGNPQDAIKITSRAIGDVAHNFSTGDVWENVYFLKDNIYQKNRSLKCISVTNNVIVMVDSSVSATSRMNEIAAFFEEKLDTFSSVFGTHLDIDGNERVILAFVPLGTDVLGYVSSIDLFGKEKYTYSNEADIIYLSSDTLSDDSYFEQTKVSVMHEYQHLVSFSNTVRKGSTSFMPTWMNEGFSMMAEYYTGESVAGKRASNFALYALMTLGNYSLLDFDNSYYNYGSVMLFFHYIRDRFGKSFFQDVYASSKNGISAIEAVTGESFNTLYRDYTLSLITTGRGITNDPRYEIEAFNLTSSDSEYTAIGFNIKELCEELLDYFPSDFYAVGTSMEPYSFIIVPWNGRINTAIYENSGERILCYALTK